MHLTCLMRNVLYKGSFRIISKSIMTTPRNLQEVLDDLKGNPFYDKYAQKIKKLHKEEPNELKARIENANKSNPKKKIDHILQNERQYSQLLTPKQKLSEPTQLKQERLENIMKIDLIRNKSSEEIKCIWEEYHRQKGHCIAAAIPSKDYTKLNENSANYPTFLFALPRTQGYEFIMCQFAQNTVHFTPLLYYQVHKANAPECLTITHYDEFKDSKGFVLMRGEYDKNVINAQEAQCLANQIQMYYVQDDPEKKKLLEIFTNEPDKFKHVDLIKQIENLSISLEKK